MSIYLFYIVLNIRVIPFQSGELVSYFVKVPESLTLNIWQFQYTTGKMADALILIGCPQIPVQSPLVLWIADFLRDAGHTPVVAANPSARQLVQTSDPKGRYVSSFVDVDKALNEMADRKCWSLIISLFHNDAGLTYTATAASLSPESVFVSVIFGEHAYELADEVEFETETVVAPVTHNTRPLLTKLGEVLEWAVLKI